VAGDVSGNGEVTSYDAALVARFAIELEDHFPVALATESDWAFLRCDNYVDEDNQDCGEPVYVHDPLLSSEVDDFYAIIYGDVTGNWAPAAGRAMRAGESPEFEAAQRDRELAERLRSTADPGQLLALRDRGGATLGAGAELVLSGQPTVISEDGRRQHFVLAVRQADGIQALDLTLRFDPRRVRILDVQTAEVSTDFNLMHNDLGGAHKIAMYGVLPLDGSGAILAITVEMEDGDAAGLPFEISGEANEQPIPVRVAGGR
jgi:hypothetical protein